MSEESSVRLHSGARMPKLGLGTWAQATQDPNFNPNLIIDAVTTAVEKCGVRHIDAAWAYQNEKEIGVALKDLFDRGVVKREDLFITTKLFAFFHSPEKVEGKLRESLGSLGLDYLDMYLIHFPIEINQDPANPTNPYPQTPEGKVDLGHTPHVDTWKAMEACVKAGLTRHIGLCNFNSKQIQRIIDAAEIKPANLQARLLPIPREELKAFCDERGMAFTAYSPIGSPGSAVVWAKFGFDHPKLMEDPVVVAMATKYGKTAAQVLIRYLYDRNMVVIPKSTNPERIKQNFDILDFKLNPEDVSALTGLKKGRIMGHAFDWGIDHPEYPFHEPF